MTGEDLNLHAKLRLCESILDDLRALCGRLGAAALEGDRDTGRVLLTASTTTGEAVFLLVRVRDALSELAGTPSGSEE